MTGGPWPEVALGDVCDPVSRRDPACSGVDRFTYVDLGSVDQHRKAVTGAQELQTSDAPSRARQVIAAGDVLVSTVRPNLNAVATVPTHLDGATASTGFAVLRPSVGKLDTSYVAHWVRSPAFVADMVRKATGASYPAVSDRIVKQSRIPLPRIAEQRQIARVLDQADALRARRRESLALLGSLTESIFLDMFGDPATNPKGWLVTPLSSLVRSDDRINYGVVQPGEPFAGGVPLVRAADIISGAVAPADELRTISPAIDAKHARSRLRGCELLVSCVGSIGAVALATEAHRGFNIARAVARVPLRDDVSRDYVAAYVSAPLAQRYFTAELRTVAQPTLNIKQLKALPVRLPPRSEQIAFERALSASHHPTLSARNSAKCLDELFASLQHRAFRGEL